LGKTDSLKVEPFMAVKKGCEST